MQLSPAARIGFACFLAVPCALLGWELLGGGGSLGGVVGALRLASLVGLFLLGAALLFVPSRGPSELDPADGVPDPVTTALDALAEGVVILDRQQRIVFANAAFCGDVERTRDELHELPISELDWRTPATGRPASLQPWNEALRTARRHGEAPLALDVGSGARRAFMVSAAPLLDAQGLARGAMATFDDVTELERRTRQLEGTLIALEQSRDQVRMQNEELRMLATRDALTGVLNRRSFIEEAGVEFETARRSGAELSCLMVDVDRFKSINDAHGHALGDQVLQGTAQSLHGMLRSADMICRYGGEEFCVLLMGTKLEEAERTAERLRRALEAQTESDIPVTASFGVTSLEFGAQTLTELIDQADQALYASKKRGRNCVTRWDWTDGFRASDRSEDA